MNRLASVLAVSALLVGLAGGAAFYLTYRPSGAGEWAAAAADFGALAFAEPWVAALAGAAVVATVLVLLHFVRGRSRPAASDGSFYPLPGSPAESSRRREGLLRIAASLCWLVLAVVVFRVPFEVALGPYARAAGLDRLAPPAPGFVLRVTSEPPGGRLWVNGIDRGTAPIVTNVICQGDRPVRLRVEKEGFLLWEEQVDCQEGKTLAVDARLSK